MPGTELFQRRTLKSDYESLFLLNMGRNMCKTEQICDFPMNLFNPISTGLFCLVVALGGGGVFSTPPSITPLCLKLDCSNFVQSYFEIG